MKPLLIFAVIATSITLSYYTFTLVSEDHNSEDQSETQTELLPDDISHESFLLINEASASPLLPQEDDRKKKGHEKGTGH